MFAYPNSLHPASLQVEADSDTSAVSQYQNGLWQGGKSRLLCLKS